MMGELDMGENTGRVAYIITPESGVRHVTHGHHSHITRVVVVLVIRITIIFLDISSLCSPLGLVGLV